MDALKVFIGYDSQEPIAWQVLAHSILRRATQPIAIYPLAQPLLKRCYWRDRRPTEATEFSLTRFLVPHLCDFRGFALFLDCDMLCLADIGDLMLYPLADPGKAVYVAQHDYIPKDLVKFDGHEQTTYPRKNWSSVMLFDCAKCTALTPEYVNHAAGLDLHRFHWLRPTPLVCPLCGSTEKTFRKEPNWPRCRCDACGKVFDVPVGREHGGDCGAIPLEWNWLVGEYDQNPHAKLLHYTVGGPYFEQYRDCDHADLWWQEFDHMLTPARPGTIEAVA